MAITVRKILTLDYNSVKFEVNGITNDRYTEVYIPQQDEWFGLLDAEDLGYIVSVETEFDDYTGSNHIQVTFDTSTIEQGYPVWHFRVSNYKNGSPTDSVEYVAAVRFKYENTSTKVTGEPVDITVRDMFMIYRYAYLWHRYLFYFDVISSNLFYGIDKGDDFYYSLLENPAFSFFNVVDNWGATLYQENIIEKLENILNNVYQGADFKAEYFNDIKYVVNNYYLDVS